MEQKKELRFSKDRKFLNLGKDRDTHAQEVTQIDMDRKEPHYST
jgi:hypothetical protein